MRLAIQLFGSPQFQLDDVPVAANRRAVVALLAYLAVDSMEHPKRRYSRESLGVLLWTDYEPARALTNLRHTLWEISQFIGEGWIVAEHESISLNPQADLFLDVAEFRLLLARASREADPLVRIPLLREATRLYRGDFLSGFSLKGASNFNEWVLSEDERLKRDLAAALNMIVDDYENLNQGQLAIPYAQRLIALDPLNEAPYRTLMQLYALTEQQTAAIQQYQRLEKLLRKELNLDPQPETRDLYKKIRKGELKPLPSGRKLSGTESDLARHNLPTELTTFIGRENERNEISRLILHNRLVTVVGSGGMGKTRLALQSGHFLLDQYPDGVWFIALDALTEADAVPSAIASPLGIVELPERSLVQSLLQSLRERILLLILDNCEHLLDACAELAELILKNCPRVHILATSRDLLRVEGEASYHLPSLPIPRAHTATPLNELVQNEAVRLFAERATLVVLGFQITEANVGSVIQVCDRLDGIPLAIELAAAHVDVFTVDEILEQLNRSFDLLVSNTRSVLPRHQTMHMSIEWGWNLLSEAERVFVRRVSVFIGGWTLQSAQVVESGNVRALTSTLLKKSFVTTQKQNERDTRYRFHEVVRSYAQEKLIDAGEEHLMRDRHLQYFVDLTHQFEPALRGVDQGLWLERLFLERDNIRAALGWAARTHVQAGLYLSNRLRSFWEHYEFREEAGWLLMI